MADLLIFDQNGKEIGISPVPDCFVLEQVNSELIWEIVIAQNAASRQGTHSTKGRGDVRGGGAKPWKQKGSGRARAGSNRSPIWRGGGIVFGPTPRNYSKNISSKKKKVALCHIITEKISQNKIVLVDNFSLKEIKTSNAAVFLNAVLTSAPFSNMLNTIKKYSNKKKYEPILYIGDDLSYNEVCSFRNIPWVCYIDVRLLSPASVFYASGIIISSKALDKLVERLNFGAKVLKSEEA